MVKDIEIASISRKLQTELSEQHASAVSELKQQLSQVEQELGAYV